MGLLLSVLIQNLKLKMAIEIFIMNYFVSGTVICSENVMILSCVLLTMTLGSGAAAAVSVFEDRFKPNLEVRLTICYLVKKDMI